MSGAHETLPPIMRVRVVVNGRQYVYSAQLCRDSDTVYTYLIPPPAGHRPGDQILLEIETGKRDQFALTRNPDAPPWARRLPGLDIAERIIGYVVSCNLVMTRTQLADLLINNWPAESQAELESAGAGNLVDAVLWDNPAVANRTRRP